MCKSQLVPVAALLTLAFLATNVQAGPPVRLSVGVNLGGHGYHRPYYHHHYHPYHYHYVRPYPYYVVPEPVYYEPAPVVVRPAPIVVRPTSDTPVYQSAPVASTPSVSTVQATAVSQGNADFHLQRLSSADDTIRREAVMELGRMKSTRAVDAITATLAGDQSPTVRDAAARALGLIGAPRSLTALIHAAQADADRDVRHSAQFAVEIIRANLPRN